MSRVALYVGRFQPFHNGHMHALRSILSESDKVLIVLGSAQKQFEPENPLTLEERLDLVRLNTEGMEVEVFTLDDIHDDNQWVEYLTSNIPHYDAVYSGSKIVQNLFKTASQNILPVEFLEGVTGTLIRERALIGDDYADLVSPVTFDYLQNINFADRIREIANSQ